jgi:S1-C subfamily serine protease
MDTSPDVFSELGMDVRELTPTEQSRLRTKGVMVQKIDKGGIIDKTNMEEEYIITSVNDTPIESVNDLATEINKVDKTIMLNGFYERFPGKYPYSFEKR